MKLIIEEATKKDIPQLIKLTEELDAEEERIQPLYEARDKKYAKKRKKELEKQFNKYLKYKNRNFFKAVVNGKIVGYASVRIFDRESHKIKKASYISGLVVTKKYWRRGIGTQLIRKCIDYLRSKGREYVGVGSLAKNKRALNLYKKVGFKEDGVFLVRGL